MNQNKAWAIAILLSSIFFGITVGMTVTYSEKVKKKNHSRTNALTPDDPQAPMVLTPDSPEITHEADTDMPTEAAAEEKKKTSWSYKGRTGPKHWAELDPSYTLCEVGQNQSPIAIHNSMHASELKPLVFNYNVTVVSVYNRKTHLDIQIAPGNTLSFRQKSWQLHTITIKTPSEHSLKSEKADAELQLSHSDDQDNSLILAIFANAGSLHRELDKIIDAIPGSQGHKRDISGIDLRFLIPRRKSYFLYPGSIPQPPCREGVSWIVLRDPILMAPRQLDKLEHIFGKNIRPPQPLHARIPLRN